MDYKDRVALVITIGGEIMGIGRYDRLDDPAEAEVAFNIADAHQGRGIGSILLEHLAAAARENGIRKFSAEVLPENRKMLMVFSDAGYDVKRHFDDGVVSLEFNIDPTDKSRAVMESREHRAEARSIQELLAPSSVAVIGASRKWGTVGYQLLEHVIEGGFTGPVYAINPEALELAGMLSFARLSEVPGPVKLAIIAVPYDEVPKVVQECAAAGVKGIVVATAGYADDGERGLARQRELVRQARANGMRVIGPASLGIVNTNPAVSLNASMAPALARRGGLGLFSQSAAIGVSLYAASSRRRVGISTFLSAGNRADVSGNDMMQYWEDDADTTAVGLYLESIGNPRKFSRLARRLARTKPVIVAKSDAMGLNLPPGHAVRTTQAPPEALDAMMRQAGVIRVETIEELMDVAQIVSSQPLPEGPGIAVFSNSARPWQGGGGQCRRPGARRGTDRDRRRPRRRHVPGTAGPAAEPAGNADRRTRCTRRWSRCFRRAGSPSKRSPGCWPNVPRRPANRWLPPSPESLIPPSTWRAWWAPSRSSRARLAPTPPVPCYSNPGAAVAALAAVVRYAQWLDRDQGLFVEPEGCHPDAARADLEQLLHDVRRRAARAGWTRTTAARLLGHYGIRVVPSVGFETAEEAVAAAGQLGWPVALKTTDPGTAAPAGPGRGAAGHPGRRFAAAQRAADAPVAGAVRLAVPGSADHGARGAGLHFPRH